MPNKRSSFLVFGKPSITEAEIREVTNTLKTGWWGTGPKTEQFESKVSAYVGSKYALAVNSATAGLHLALKALGVGPGDEVITTPLTFCATANVIVHCGAKPVFADVDKSTWNILPDDIERKITKKTKVILPVHLHGRVCDMDAIKRIARKHKLYIVEDAAHAIAAKYHGQQVGSIGDITVFSFYVTKNLATGEGGMITTNNKSWHQHMKIMSLHGLSKDAYKRYSVKHFVLYECLEPGFKYNLTDIASSIGLYQLKRLNKMQRQRARLWKIYEKNLNSLEEIILPVSIESNSVHAMHIYAIILRLEKLSIDRNTFIDKLIKENIGSGVHFAPLHLTQFYRNTYKYREGMFPNAEFIGYRIVSLPLSGAMTKQDALDVVHAVKKIIRRYRYQ